MASVEITKSVGAKAPNVASDVMVVQQLLTNAGQKPGPIDGIMGKKTYAAILAFQQTFLRLPDGVVDPGGLTFRRLSGKIVTPIAPGPPVVTAPTSDWSGDAATWTQEKKLSSLHPDFYPKVIKIIATLKERGFKPKVFYGWRSVSEQERLFNAGNSKVRFSFHNAQTVSGTPSSWAVDIVDRRYGWGSEAKTFGYWKAQGEIAKANGCVWGGDWADLYDPAHIQGRQNSELKTVKLESGL